MAICPQAFGQPICTWAIGRPICTWAVGCKLIQIITNGAFGAFYVRKPQTTRISLRKAAKTIFDKQIAPRPFLLRRSGNPFVLRQLGGPFVLRQLGGPFVLRQLGAKFVQIIANGAFGVFYVRRPQTARISRWKTP